MRETLNLFVNLKQVVQVAIFQKFSQILVTRYWADPKCNIDSIFIFRWARAPFEGQPNSGNAGPNKRIYRKTTQRIL